MANRIVELHDAKADMDGSSDTHQRSAAVRLQAGARLFDLLDYEDLREPHMTIPDRIGITRVCNDKNG